MTDYKKQGLIAITLILFAVFQALMVIAHFLGADLTFHKDIKISNLTDTFISFFIFMINLYFFVSICTKTSKALLKCLFFIPIYIGIMIFDKNGESAFIFTIIFIIIIFYTSKKIGIKSFIKRIIFLSGITVFYQFCTYLIKTNFYFDISFIQNLVFSIDYIILLFLIKKGGEYNDETRKEKSRKERLQWIKLVLFPKHSRSFRICRKSSKEVDQELTDKQRIVFISLVIFTQAFLLAIIMISAFKLGTIKELVFILFSFWVFRKALGVSWHSKSFLICSFAAFYIFINSSNLILSLPVNISLMSSIGIGLLIAIPLHLYELKSNQLERKNQAIIKMADMLTPEKVIRYKVRSKGLKKTHADAMIKREIEGKTVKEVAFEMGYSEDSIKRFCREYRK